jgi:hypothetical protein
MNKKLSGAALLNEYGWYSHRDDHGNKKNDRIPLSRGVTPGVTFESRTSRRITSVTGCHACHGVSRL